MNNQFFLQNLWRWKCGIVEKDPEQVALVELEKTEWSTEFEILMRNRLVLGAIRYRRIGAQDKPAYKRVASIKRRIEKYEASGNKEFLVDVANLCLLEFVECRHPKQHFEPIDDGEHVKFI